MTSRALARRYASALFGVVHRMGQASRVATDLASARDLIAGHADLKRVLETPVVPAPKKEALIEALVATGGGVSEPARRMLALLAREDQLTLLPELVEAFHARLPEAGHAVEAEVVTAVPLDPAIRERLEAALGQATDQPVQVTARVDPSIVGGVVARVGSLVFDGSVARQVERLQQSLLARV